MTTLPARLEPKRNGFCPPRLELVGDLLYKSLMSNLHHVCLLNPRSTATFLNTNLPFLVRFLELFEAETLPQELGTSRPLHFETLSILFVYDCELSSPGRDRLLLLFNAHRLLKFVLPEHIFEREKPYPYFASLETL